MKRFLFFAFIVLFSNVFSATPESRVAVFAHYDHRKIIDDYVVYYLAELKKVASNIVFVSDCNLSDKEKSKIKGLVSHIIDYKHGEYDFGSYKRGYNYLKTNKVLDKCDELIFCNDSCLGPLYSFETVWEKMDKEKCDFWGMTKFVNSKNKAWRHVQSYFVVFHRNVFTSKVFDKFITSITKQQNKGEIVRKYENGMSVLLEKNGFTLSSYIDDRMSYAYCFYLAEQNPINPLVKTTIFRTNFIFIIEKMLNKMQERIQITYPQSITKNYIERFNNVGSFFQKLEHLFGSIFRIHLGHNQFFWLGKKHEIF